MELTVQFRQTSEHGLTPAGKVDPANLLNWLNERIIKANLSIETSGHNGASNPYSEGYRCALKELKTELFGQAFNT